MELTNNKIKNSIFTHSFSNFESIKIDPNSIISSFSLYENGHLIYYIKEDNKISITENSNINTIESFLKNKSVKHCDKYNNSCEIDIRKIEKSIIK